MNKRALFLFVTLCISLYSTTQNEIKKYIPSEENLTARKWFEAARFGLFVHWGVYSILGDGEWVMNKKNIPKDTYEILPSLFNPTEFDANEWVKIAKNAGMKYITITSRHHDGFSMFNSKVTDYNIVSQTPYSKDILKELSEACHSEGIKLFFYYSLLDWYRDDYFPRGKTGNGITGRSEGRWTDYIEFMKAQLSELLTNYGPIAGIWLDGHWDKKDANWHYDEIYELIHQLQPSCLIGNNHHQSPKWGEDFQMFERDFPGKNTTGFGTVYHDVSTNMSLEVCETINGYWGFKYKANKHKSAKRIIKDLIISAGYGSNFLLNVGPMPNGQIQSEHVATLKEVGDWLSQNGKAIYDTHAGPFPPSDSMVSTMKKNKIFIHFIGSDRKTFEIPNKNLKIESVILLKSKNSIDFNTNSNRIEFSIPNGEIDDIATIIQINLF